MRKLLLVLCVFFYAPAAVADDFAFGCTFDGGVFWGACAGSDCTAGVAFEEVGDINGGEPTGPAGVLEFDIDRGDVYDIMANSSCEIV